MYLNKSFLLNTLSLSPRLTLEKLSGPSHLRRLVILNSVPPLHRPAAHATSSSEEVSKQLTRAIRDATTLSQLYRTLDVSPEALSTRHLTFALLRASRLTPRDARKDPKIAALIEQLLEQHEVWNDIMIANVFEACIRMHLQTTELGRRLIAAADGQLALCTRTYKWRSIVSLMHSMSKLGRTFCTDPFLMQIESALLSSSSSDRQLECKFEDFEDLWSLSWALCELNCSLQLADALFTYASTQMNSLSPKELAYLARLAADRCSPDISMNALEALSAAVSNPSWNYSRTESRNISMILFNIAKLVQKAADGAVDDTKITELDQNEILYASRRETQIVSVHVKVPLLEPAILNLLRAAYNMAPTLAVDDVRSIAMALAHLRRFRSGLVPIIAERAAELADRMDASSIAATLWALAILRHDSEAFIQVACPSFLKKIEAETFVQKIAENDLNALWPMHTMLYSLAVLNRCEHPAAQQLLPKLVSLLIPYMQSEYIDTEIKNYLPMLGWSLVVAKGASHNEIILQALRAWRGAITTSNPLKRHLPIIQHVDIAIRIECPDLGSNLPAQYDAFFSALYDSGRLLQKAAIEWDAQKDRVLDTIEDYAEDDDESEIKVESNFAPKQQGSSSGGSRFQKSVYEAACRVIPGWELEYWERDLWYPVDAALPQYKIAIEADGPTHYAMNTLRPLGKTVLKQRLLKQLGWIVISVPNYEWSDEKEENIAYLARKFEDAGVDVEKIVAGEFDGDKDAESAVTATVPQPAVIEQKLNEEEAAALAERAQTLDLFKARQGKLSKTALAMKAAMRKTAHQKNKE